MSIGTPPPTEPWVDHLKNCSSKKWAQKSPKKKPHTCSNCLASTESEKHKNSKEVPQNEVPYKGRARQQPICTSYIYQQEKTEKPPPPKNSSTKDWLEDKPTTFTESAIAKKSAKKSLKKKSCTENSSDKHGYSAKGAEWTIGKSLQHLLAEQGCSGEVVVKFPMQRALLKLPSYLPQSIWH